MPSRTNSQVLRVVGFVMIGLGVLVAALRVVALVNAPVAGVADPLAWLAALAGIGFVLIAAHALLNRSALPEEYEALAKIAGRLEELGRAIDAVDARARAMTEQPKAGASRGESGPAFPAAGETVDLRNQLARLVKLVEDVRDFAMMTEDQKQAVLWQELQRRKQETLGEIHRHMTDLRWADADRLLKTLEGQFPGETEIKHTRWEFNQGQQNAEEDAFLSVRQRVEDFIAVSSWDQAMGAIQDFVANYPRNVAGRQLLERITREREVAVEGIVTRLHEEIVSEVERRHWRRGLAAARRLVERFPEHPRTKKIMGQIAVIQDNAQIEERQEQELRIQELIRGQRFTEAVELSEDLIDRYPVSPQAESLRLLLPKLRELVAQQMEESIS